MVHNLSERNSVLSGWIAQIRDVNIQSDRLRFRRNMERLGEVAAYELSKQLDYETVTIETPLGEATCSRIKNKIILATILRAGLPLQQGILNYFDDADCAFIAGYRKHHKDGSFEIAQHYMTTPDVTGSCLILSDPMLATGSSALLAIQTLTADAPPKQIHMVTAIATNTAIALLTRKYPNINIWAGAIDDELTAKGYIVPGLGDAGDLSYGNKIQS